MSERDEMVSKKEVRYRESCPTCQKKFKYKHHLNQHMAVHTGEKKFICRICKKGYQQKWNLITHVQRVHAKIQPFKCKDCNKTFGYSTHFKQHIKIHLFDKVDVPEEIKNKILKPFSCEYCSKSFKTNFRLQVHIDSKHGDETFICEKCGKTFKTKYSIRDHIKKVHDTDSSDGYVCDQCGMIYNNKRTLRQHEKSGHGKASNITNYDKKEKIACEVCGKVVSKTSLRNHLNIHYKSRLYPCRYCDKRFLEYGNRKNHERTHTGEKPYVCEICGKKHAQLGNLITHRKSAHHLTDKIVRVAQQKEKREVRMKEVKRMTREKEEVLHNENNLDYSKELEKITEFVASQVEYDEKEAKTSPTLENLKNIADKWVCKQFQDCKENRSKEKQNHAEKQPEQIEIPEGRFLPDGPNETEFINCSTDTADEHMERNEDDEDDEESEVPLSELKIKQKEETKTEKIPNDSKNKEKQAKKRKSGLEKYDPIFTEVLNDINKFRRKTNELIFEELKKALEERLKDNEKEYKKLQKVFKSLENVSENKCSLTLFLKRYKSIPNNSIIMKENEGYTWNCWKCTASFKSYFSLNRHLVIHMPEQNPFKCPMCSSTCTQLSNLKQHIMIHYNELMYYCEICGCGFRHKTNFKIHLARHGVIDYKGTSVKLKFTCRYCEKPFHSRYHAVEHERTHTKESPYMCKICGKRYRTRSAFTKHTKSHFNIKNYQCSVCDKSFATKYLVNRHLLTHSGEKNFKCDCGKLFSQKCSLKKHKMYCVNNEQPCKKQFICSACPKSFYLKHDLDRHVLTHDPTKKYQCEICLLPLKTKLSHRRHVERHLRGDLSYLECKNCQQKFRNRKLYKEHTNECAVSHQTNTFKLTILS